MVPRADGFSVPTRTLPLSSAFEARTLSADDSRPIERIKFRVCQTSRTHLRDGSRAALPGTGLGFSSGDRSVSLQGGSVRVGLPAGRCWGRRAKMRLKPQRFPSFSGFPWFPPFRGIFARNELRRERRTLTLVREAFPFPVKTSSNAERLRYTTGSNADLELNWKKLFLFAPRGQVQRGPLPFPL